MNSDSEIAAVLLAAGGSSRLGRSKQLLQFQGRSLVRRAAEQLAGLDLDTFVVTGSERESVAGELRGLPVKQVHNEQWRAGMGTSIALGVGSLGSSARAALIVLADQYGVRPGDLRRLIDAWRADPARIVASRWADAFGPPAIFPARFFGQLKRLRGDTGARGLLEEHRAEVRFIDIPGAARDVDVAADLAAMIRHDS